MPTVTVELFVKHNPEGNRADYYLELSSLAEFWEIADLGFQEVSRVAHGNPKGSLEIRVSEDDPRLEKILRIAARYEFFPCKRVGLPLNERGKQFAMRRRREYSANEIAAAELLRLNRYSALGKNTLAEAAYPKNPDPNCNYAAVLREAIGNDDEGWRVRATRSVKKSNEWGQSDAMCAFIIGPTLKLDLENAGLLGLSFTPLRYDRPEKADRQLWTFGHETKMPPCLLPRVQQGYDDCLPDTNDVDGALWDDGGYTPEELRFDRKEVERMGKFDVATTREKVGSNGSWMMSEVIVTQRFRHTLEALQIPNVGFIPVRLV